MLHVDNITSIFYSAIIILRRPKVTVSDFSQIEQLMDKIKNKSII